MPPSSDRGFISFYLKQSWSWAGDTTPGGGALSNFLTLLGDHIGSLTSGSYNLLGANCDSTYSYPLCWTQPVPFSTLGDQISDPTVIKLLISHTSTLL